MLIKNYRLKVGIKSGPLASKLVSPFALYYQAKRKFMKCEEYHISVLKINLCLFSCSSGNFRLRFISMQANWCMKINNDWFSAQKINRMIYVTVYFLVLKTREDLIHTAKTSISALRW